MKVAFINGPCDGTELPLKEPLIEIVVLSQEAGDGKRLTGTYELKRPEAWEGEHEPRYEWIPPQKI